MSQSILLVDDDQAVRDVLRKAFEKHGWTVYSAPNGKEGVHLYRTHRPDVSVLDLGMPGISGLDVLRRIRDTDPNAAVVMLTGSGDVESAVEAVQMGAENYLTKPVEMDHLLAVVERIMETVRLRAANTALHRYGRPTGGLSEFDALSAISGIRTQIERFAGTDSPVLITGEAGTGKAWAARAIHDRSARNTEPLIRVNCAELDGDSIETVLFGDRTAEGRQRGILEAAHGGTLLLEEVSALKGDFQPTLLGVLEAGSFIRPGGEDTITIDVRVIATSTRDLEAAVQAGSFRKDLFYRLSVLPLRMPPLREQPRSVIQSLATQVFEARKRALNRPSIALSSEAVEQLSRYGWPGNLREMLNVIERMVILGGPDGDIGFDHLPKEIAGDGDDEGEITALEDVEWLHIAKILRRCDGNRSQAAKLLGVTRGTLYNKMDKYGLEEVGRLGDGAPAA